MDREKSISEISLDQQFLNRAQAVVESRLADHDFTIEDFAIAMHISRQHLNRKLKAITNLTARDFIKEHRLKKAADLLKLKSAYISEIAYAIGFQNPSYFSECFKKRFGCVPKEYLEFERVRRYS